MSQDEDRKRTPAREIASATSTLLRSQARMEIREDESGPDEEGPDLETIEATLEEMRSKTRSPSPE